MLLTCVPVLVLGPSAAAGLRVVWRSLIAGYVKPLVQEGSGGRAFFSLVVLLDLLSQLGCCSRCAAVVVKRASEVLLFAWSQFFPLLTSC